MSNTHALQPALVVVTVFTPHGAFRARVEPSRLGGARWVGTVRDPGGDASRVEADALLDALDAVLEDAEQCAAARFSCGTGGGRAVPEDEGGGLAVPDDDAAPGLARMVV